MLSSYRWLIIVAGVVVTACDSDRAAVEPVVSLSRIAIAGVSSRYGGLNLGYTLPLRVVGFNDAGDTIQISATPMWWSDDPGIASVNAAGVVTAVSLGRTYIHAEVTEAGATLGDSLSFLTADVHLASKGPERK